MKLKQLCAVAVLSVAGAAFVVPPAAAQAQDTGSGWVNKETRNLKKYELGRRNLAISGYDPVAYFAEGGGKPRKGKKDITYTHRGVLYRFATTQNRDRFIDDPDKYEPAHGGWCSYAAANETYTEPNPKRFVIQNGRLFLFYDGFFGDTYKDWHKEGPAKLEKQADLFWKSQTGEEARIPE